MDDLERLRAIRTRDEMVLRGILLVAAVAFLSFALLAAAALASAQERPADLPELTLAPCPDAAAVTAVGSTLTASPAWQACVLSRLRGLSLLLPYVHLMETRLRLVDERDELHARALALADRDAELAGEQAAVASAALEAALRRARDAEAERDAWWRSPILWLAVGVVLTVALEIAAVAALGAVVP